jgi:lipopolysaccharide biosynthesis glycosyltransferase
MNIVFCADRGVVPGLHVAAYSILDRISPAVILTRFFVFSDSLDESDISLLKRTLHPLNKQFSLELCKIDSAQFKRYPSLNGSWATYYRLCVPKVLDSNRFLYVDVDTLCGLDVSSLNELDMKTAAAALVPEAPLALAADRGVSYQLGNSSTEPYFNAGIMLVNVGEWRRQKITERAMEYLTVFHPDYWDQSALNVVLHGNAISLDEKYNSIANMRRHWPVINKSYRDLDCLVHFLDYPKPWDFLGELVHPQYELWHSVLEKTAMKEFSSWNCTQIGKIPKNRKIWPAYQKALKDRFLFLGYSKGWFKRVKGVKE